MVTRPLRVSVVERHDGVDHDQFIDQPLTRGSGDRWTYGAKKSARAGNKPTTSQKIKGIRYRRFEYPGRNTSVTWWPYKSIAGYVMSVARGSITGAHLGIRAIPLKALLNIYSRLDVPEEVMSDQGMQFTSVCMRKICCLPGTKQMVTSPNIQSPIT
ncbi:reverse transcriptase [Plakobranchus ocellatus]|uniref:Reverse transcriptase n=1 Tax=Plakobranchus ocellatus TaxID=259542 RepID=A0AAV4AH32_9GAST|nr:reverse transcriptase [Plakobranchus ocellatus]